MGWDVFRQGRAEQGAVQPGREAGSESTHCNQMPFPGMGIPGFVPMI